MVEEARKRGINAEVGDILQMHSPPGGHQWDVAFAGLNVFHYLPANRLADALASTAAVVKDRGYFISDFIAPDHVRWYPNVMLSADQQVVSLRTPRLVEVDNRMYQESSIINMDFRGDVVDLNDSGTHRRHLPPMSRVRQMLTDSFGGPVQLFDAVSLEELPVWADTCPSTRYVAVAQKSRSS